MERPEGEHRFSDISSDQVNLLISLLIRFPHISAVHYEPSDRSLRFVYLLKGVKRDDLQQFVQRAKAHLEAFHSLSSSTRPIPQVASIQHEEIEGLWTLQVRRDVESLSYEELSLINQVVSDSLGNGIILDSVENIDEDFFDEDGNIASLLSTGVGFGEEKLSGFRENGKVLVFSTPVKS